jgi:hypothetical protein
MIMLSSYIIQPESFCCGFEKLVLIFCQNNVDFSSPFKFYVDSTRDIATSILGGKA